MTSSHFDALFEVEQDPANFNSSVAQILAIITLHHSPPRLTPLALFVASAIYRRGPDATHAPPPCAFSISPPPMGPARRAAADESIMEAPCLSKKDALNLVAGAPFCGIRQCATKLLRTMCK